MHALAVALTFGAVLAHFERNPAEVERLERVQAQIRHKQSSRRATPIYSVLSLSSPPLRTEW